MASRKPDKGRLPKRMFKKARLQGPAIPPGTQVVYSPAGRERMSDVLEDLVEPYREMAVDAESFRKLLSLGVAAWNAALLPEDRRWSMIDELIDAAMPAADERDRAGALAIIQSLVRRKLEHFAENRRMIYSFELTDRGDDFHLAVASTL